MNKNDDTESGERTRNPPSYTARMSAVHNLGIELSTDLLNTEQAERCYGRKLHTVARGPCA